MSTERLDDLMWLPRYWSQPKTTSDGCSHLEQKQGPSFSFCSLSFTVAAGSLARSDCNK